MRKKTCYTIILVLFLILSELIAIITQITVKDTTPITSAPTRLKQSSTKINFVWIDIGRAKLTFKPQEGYNNKFKNSVIAMSKLQDIQIPPDEVFSFNKSTDLLSPKVDSIYYPGYDIVEELVPAGGICSVSVLIASGANNALFQFVDLDGTTINKPIGHRDYFELYHRTEMVDGINVTNIDATVATAVDKNSNAYSLNDVRFKNTSGKTISLKFDWDFTTDMLSAATPYKRNNDPVSMTVHIKALQ